MRRVLPIHRRRRSAAGAARHGPARAAGDVPNRVQAHHHVEQQPVAEAAHRGVHGHRRKRGGGRGTRGAREARRGGGGSSSRGAAAARGRPDGYDRFHRRFPHRRRRGTKIFPRRQAQDFGLSPLGGVRAGGGGGARGVGRRQTRSRVLARVQRLLRRRGGGFQRQKRPTRRALRRRR